MTKYNAKKVVIDGIKFDSKIESKYYEYLKDEKSKGNIIDFEIQPKFLLQEAFEKHGEKVRKIEYKADFKVFLPDGTYQIIDIKGMMTPVFKLKEKIFKKKFDHKLILLNYVAKHGGWIEVKELERIRKENKKAKKKKNSK
jgi:Protein of unknown function (DUF1064)